MMGIYEAVELLLGGVHSKYLVCGSLLRLA